MKHLFSLILLSLICNAGFSQNPAMNIGVGFPVFFNSNFNEGSRVHQLTNRVHLFAEIPFYLGSEKKISVHPGVGYFMFKEEEGNDPTALGGNSETMLEHRGIDLYSRIFYHIASKNENYSQYYFGGTIGTYLWSKTTGNSSWWVMTNPLTSGEKTYNQSGRAFFHSINVGFTAGLKFKMMEIEKIEPALELTIYPDFVTVKEEKRTAAMLTVVLGLGQKKATRINE